MKGFVKNLNIEGKIVRLAISFIFVVFGVWELLNPTYWVVFVPKFVSVVFNPLFATRVHGLFLLILGLALISGFRRRLLAAVSTLVMLSIVSSVFLYSGFSDLLVRDIVILLCAASLIFEKE